MVSGVQVIITLLGIWLTIVTILLIWITGHYNRLTKGVIGSGLYDILESLLKEKKENAKVMLRVGQTLDLLTKDGRLHLQRVGIVRFNPFSDTGGAQSFTIALLDGQGNGVVMTSLYARAGNRWYVKEISGGRGKEVELSKEEESAIRKAFLVKGKST